MAKYMIADDHEGIFQALSRDDVIFFIPEISAGFVFDMTHTLDMSGLQV
jgi:hypothetical protein